MLAWHCVNLHGLNYRAAHRALDDQSTRGGYDSFQTVAVLSSVESGHMPLSFLVSILPPPVKRSTIGLYGHTTRAIGFAVLV